MALNTEWPAQLDCLIAAPAHHRVMLENAQVRVLETEVAPGERTPVHTHRWPAVHHILSWSAFVRRDAEDNVVVDTRVSGGAQQPPSVLWGEPLGPHSLENVGTAPLRVISVELKDAESAARVQDKATALTRRMPKWSHCGADVFTLVKSGGMWRIASMAWSAEQPPVCKMHPPGPPSTP